MSIQKTTKKTRSFRVNDTLWQMVEQTAAKQNIKTSDVIVEAIASHVGEIIRRDRSLSNQKIAEIMTHVSGLEKELDQVRSMLSQGQQDKTDEQQNTP